MHLFPILILALLIFPPGGIKPAFAADPTLAQAIAAYDQGNFDAAQNMLEKLSTKQADNPVILNNLAVIAVQKKDYEQAIKLLKRAIATDTDINTSYHNLSLIYTYKASLSYQKALSLKTDKAQLPTLSLIGRLSPATPTQVSVTEQLLAQKQIDQSFVHDYEIPAAEKSEQDQTVIAAVQKWAKSWSDQNVSGYINSYLKNYHPPTMSSHQSWKDLRRARLSNPRYIKVELSNIKISITDSIIAHVTFRQYYKSNTLESTTRKQLEMLQINMNWKIIDEKTLRQ